ncbi:MAG: CRISPR-associated CARF protein Csa3 [Candidatus Nezhaarchaeales archaeon]
MRLFAITVGFDEKLSIRGLLKIGVNVDDVIMLVYSKSGGEFEVRKVEKAVETVKDLVVKTGVKVVDVAVSGMNFYEDATIVLRALREHPAGEVIALLAGGMRLIIFEVLTAVLLYSSLSGIRARIHLMREDGLYDVALPTEVFRISITSKDAAVLRVLYEKRTMKRSHLVESVSRETGISESMVYKVIKNLTGKGLIIVDGDTLTLTDLGRLVCEALEIEKKGE